MNLNPRPVWTNQPACYKRTLYVCSDTGSSLIGGEDAITSHHIALASTELHTVRHKFSPAIT